MSDDGKPRGLRMADESDYQRMAELMKRLLERERLTPDLRSEEEDGKESQG